jgi:hypothetical protein
MSSVTIWRQELLMCRRWCAGIAPYMALELAVFDLMPTDVAPFARGFSSALLATMLCYPLDTVR